MGVGDFAIATGESPQEFAMTRDRSKETSPMPTHTQANAPLGAGYQVRQSKIAVGSGAMLSG